MADAFSAIFGEETKTPVFSGEVIAPKKSPFANRNPQLQAEDEFDAMLSNVAKQPKQQALQQPKQDGSLAQTIGGNVAGAIDLLAGVPNFVGYGVGRAFGLTPQEAQRAASKVPEAIAQPVGRLTGLAQTEAYKQSIPVAIQNYIGEHLNESAQSIASKFNIPVEDAQALLEAGLTGVGAGVAKVTPKVGGMAKTAVEPMQKAFEKAKAQMPSVRVETVGGMQPAGAAATTNKAMLDAALAEIKNPELKANLAKENPANINPEVLQRYVDADSVGVRLLKGQATQDPNLISFERNTRGQDPRLVQELNAQNKALQDKLVEVKETTAPDVFAPNYVANAEGAMEFIGSKIKQNESAVGQAYKALDDFGAGKIEVDSKTFGQNAIKALSEKEDIDFLPSIIKTKIDSYAEGKPMNFAQYENLRTQIARETRKAQKADDGNAVHALTLVRGELEKLPLIGETAEAKVLADKARATAKAEFDLLNRDSPNYNKVYADLVNGKTDTKDFIQSAILRSKNKDFAKTMELFDDPIAQQNLRAGTLDIIIKDSTDASGKFKPATFAKAIENLDVNNKLTALFGEDAEMLRKIARTGQLVEARPAGAFVNESNTATALAAQYGKKLAEQIPVVGRFVEPARQVLSERAGKKAVEESLRPGAGVRIKDIGK